MPPKQKYDAQEIVLAADKGRLYEAKVLKTHLNANKWHYFIHYQGWQPHMDCWLSEDKLRKYTLSKDSKKKKVGKLGISIKDYEKLNSTESAGEATEVMEVPTAKISTISEENAQRKKKAKTLMEAEMVEEDEDGESVVTSRLTIPTTLKHQLVDEWELIVQEPRRLLKLPKIPNVVAVLEEFLAMKKKKVDEDTYHNYKELFSGLRIYFDKALPKVLLYRQEREQWEVAKQLHPHASQVYGAEHLIRLFVRLPKLMEIVYLSQTELNHVMTKFTELLNYIQKNSGTLISKTDYVSITKAMDHITKCVQIYKEQQAKEKAAERAEKRDEERRAKQNKKAEGNSDNSNDTDGDNSNNIDGDNNNNTDDANDALSSSASTSS